VHGVTAKNARVNFTRLDRRAAYRPRFDYAINFHPFAVAWTEIAVRHYVDGVLVVDRAFEWKRDDGHDGRPAHVPVVGGRWPGPPVDAKAFPAKLAIDYIRVWQRR
jgi:beta-glucanase (GH16 family)